MRLLFRLTLLAFALALPLGCDKKSDTEDSTAAPKDQKPNQPPAPPAPPPPQPPPK